jgi:hypothetical protein
MIKYCSIQYSICWASQTWNVDVLLVFVISGFQNITSQNARFAKRTCTWWSKIRVLTGRDPVTCQKWKIQTCFQEEPLNICCVKQRKCLFGNIEACFRYHCVYSSLVFSMSEWHELSNVYLIVDKFEPFFNHLKIAGKSIINDNKKFVLFSSRL